MTYVFPADTAEGTWDVYEAGAGSPYSRGRSTIQRNRLPLALAYRPLKLERTHRAPTFNAINPKPVRFLNNRLGCDERPRLRGPIPRVPESLDLHSRLVQSLLQQSRVSKQRVKKRFIQPPKTGYISRNPARDGNLGPVPPAKSITLRAKEPRFNTSVKIVVRQPWSCFSDRWPSWQRASCRRRECS